MADRIYPRDSSPTGTYVVQIPKDQIYRVPPPENAHRYEKLARRKPRRSPCCCCLCWILGIIVLLILLATIAVGVLYLVFRPKAPTYTINDVSIKGINLTSSSDLTISPEIDVTVRAENPNKKVGIYYEKGNFVAISHSNINLCTGDFPAFYQPSKNGTVFNVTLKGSGVKLSTIARSNLLEQQSKGKIPLGLDLKVPFKLKVGSIKSTWTITVKLYCIITVDKLAQDSKIVSKMCHLSAKL